MIVIQLKNKQKKKNILKLYTGLAMAKDIFFKRKNLKLFYFEKIYKIDFLWHITQVAIKKKKKKN